MSLQPPKSFWNRIMSVVNNLISHGPAVRRVSPSPEERNPRKRRRKGASNNRAGFVIPEERNKEVLEKCDWIIDGPYRRVPPYYYTYYTWAKLRWHDTPLLQVFCTEFRDRQPEYYRAAIGRGSVSVNGKTVDETYKIQNGDCISHTIHRHEPPVSSQPIKIIHHNSETGLLVIDKPAGIPVHGAGRYHQNSIVSILRLEYGYKDVAAINRLDRLTSGVMLLGLNKVLAAEMHDVFLQRNVSKEYYCRVVGKFPDGEVKVDKPIIVVSPKHGLNRLREDGKHSSTVFEKVFYDEKREQSVVLAKPLTGRTHQIRVHLQHLGHPIANDPIYANPQIFTSLEDANTVTDEELIARLENMGKSVAATTLADQTIDAVEAGTNITPVNGLENPEMREMWSGEVCDVCGTQLYLDPAPAELEIWLHAWRYSWRSAPTVEGEEGQVWSYQSEVPAWGKEDWQGCNYFQARRSRSRSPSIVRMVEPGIDGQDDK